MSHDATISPASVIASLASIVRTQNGNRHDDINKLLADAERAIEALNRQDQGNPWKEAIVDALVVGHIYTQEHDSNPRKALSDLIGWETSVALDPAVSEAAQRLIDEGRLGFCEPLKTGLSEETLRTFRALMLLGDAEDGTRIDIGDLATLMRCHDLVAALPAEVAVLDPNDPKVKLFLSTLAGSDGDFLTVPTGAPAGDGQEADRG